MSEDRLADPGLFEARYLAFLETISHLRPSLHRYCARMTGSLLDGEDLVQDALFQAYRRLDTFDDARPLAPWLFRIAHNRCIDFLRGRRVRLEAETAVAAPDAVPAVEPAGPALGRAVEHLVLSLPPKERACVLLKDVFDYSLEEIAELVDSTIGGVKAALNRGRSKLTARTDVAPPRRERRGADATLLQLYVDRFNARDWEGLKELVAADARLLVADKYSGRLSDSPYFPNYGRVAVAWRMAVGELDGEPIVVILRRAADAWSPGGFVRLEVSDGQIIRIADYFHCPWIVPAAVSVVVH